MLTTPSPRVVAYERTWEEEARDRFQAIPSLRGRHGREGRRGYARSPGQSVITSELMAEIREKMGSRFRPQS